VVLVVELVVVVVVVVVVASAQLALRVSLIGPDWWCWIAM
jgi:hypothetical protein